MATTLGFPYPAGSTSPAGHSQMQALAEAVDAYLRQGGGEVLLVAVSDEATALTTGAAKVTLRAPYAMTLTQIPRASLNTASSSGVPTVDINVGGTSILHATNKLTIDASEKTSTTAAQATSLVTTSIADDAEITFDIDVAGTGAKGLKVTLYYTRA